MRNNVKTYDAYIKTCLEEKIVTQKIIEYHRLQISYLQHERLIHLMVTSLVSLLLFGSFCLMLWAESVLITVLCSIFLVVDGFYLWHYYFLENKVQDWYIIEKKLVDINDNKL